MSLTSFPVVTPPQVVLPQPLRYSVAEFHELRAKPEYENRRLILVEGVILEMPNPNPPHDASLLLAQHALAGIFAAGYCIRPQMALVFGLSTDPVPDIAVVAGSPRDFKEHPRSALLVVEIADSTLAYDTREKANLYAAGGIKDYWVVDLVHRTLLVCRDPATDVRQIYGAGYRSRTTLSESDNVQPLVSPDAAPILIRDLLP
jgi:Uma2 family endonuclease